MDLKALKRLFYLHHTEIIPNENPTQELNPESLRLKNTEPEAVFSYDIGFIDSKSQEFVKINEKLLSNYWKKTFELSEDTEFLSAKLVKAQVNQGEKDYYIINTTSKSGKINISSKVYKTDVGFVMAGEECKCESTECTFSGCEVMSMCSCTSCSGECKKTHTLKEGLALSAFELN